ncbi:hypothetical protein UFOVP1367_21 [uncultured Caudovirales phage]|uniref:Uncharacterized protein n=1 Tax=uncultured Caudovirales phage TaxID=2100421 RepID=A0A6J5S4N7_9CAUD|nr:virion structural protein [uncultured Caudovirales phage]CAB4202526.1 hypothetical protein UFOVP1367_21 [uncultured Caudovirales phage]
MYFKLSQDIRNDCLTAIVSSLGSAGVIEFYSGSLPATVGAETTSQTLIATCALSSVAGVVSAGTLTFNTITDDLATDATGVIAFGRAKDSSGAFVFDGDAGNSAIVNAVETCTAVFIFNSTSALAGGVTRLVSGSITTGNK